MSGSNKQHTDETRIALLEQGMQQILEKITDEFINMKADLREFSTKSELQMAIQERDSKISEMEIRFTNSIASVNNDLKEMRPKFARTTVITAVTSIIITFLVTYVLTDLIK